MDGHDNHRNRVKARFLSEGLDGFEEHQVVELLLYYGIPRVDTNETAHRLVKRFGSFRGVLDADYNELISIDGIGPNCATLIKLTSAMARRYAVSEFTPGERYETLDKIGKYLIALYMGQTVEKVYLLLFNGKMEMIECAHICDGSINSVAFSPRVIIEKAMLSKASGIVLAHNHPSGLAVPSGSDIELTAQLEYLCVQVGVNLLEHIVVSGNSFSPIIRKRSTTGNDEINIKKY